MSKKTGINEPTLSLIIKAKNTRKYLSEKVSEKVSWRDIYRIISLYVTHNQFIDYIVMIRKSVLKL